MIILDFNRSNNRKTSITHADLTIEKPGFKKILPRTYMYTVIGAQRSIINGEDKILNIHGTNRCRVQAGRRKPSRHVAVTGKLRRIEF